MTRNFLILFVFGFLVNTGTAQICTTPAPYIWYQPGLVHKPSVGVGNDVKTLTITPPVTYQFTRLTIEMDVKHAGWAPAPGNGNGPSDYHVIFWCERGAWEDNLFGFVSVRGPGKNELDQQTNLDFNGNQVTAVSRSKIYLTPGETYHFKHIYDSKMQSVYTIVSHNGIDIAATMQPSTTVNPIQTPNSTVPGKPDVFYLWLAHEANTPGPEVPTYGWEYSNVLFKLENNPLDPPIANFTMSDADPVSGQAVTFDAGLANGALNAWSWNMGDGSALKNGKTITHAYAAAGNYNVRLIVDDNQGCKDTLYRTVTVANPPPADLKVEQPVRYLPADPHYLEYKGKFELFSGYYPNMGAWTNFPTALWYENIDISTFYKNFIDLAVSKGLNYCRAPLTFGMPSVNKRDQNIHPYLRTGPGNAGDGKPKFDLTKFNPAFFDYWRDVFQYAYSKGVVMQISIFDGAHVRGECADPATAWDYYFGASNINGVDAVDNKKWHDVNQISSFNAQKAFVEKVIDELDHYPNVIWEVCNENLVAGGSTWDLALANHFTAQEAAKGFKPHLVIPRDLPDHESLNHWLNPVAQVRTTLINKLYLNQPLFSDNDCCLEDADPDYRRNRAWAALTAGAQINYFQQKLGDEINFSLPDVQDAMRWVGYTRKFVNTLGVNLPGMVPSDNLVTNGWCLAKPAHDEFVIYLINGGATQVSSLPAVYKATWFDPRNGTFQPAGAGPTFTPPGAGDWVLHIGKPYSDVKAVSVGEPFSLGCATSVQPLLVVENIGPVTVSQVSVDYRIDGGPVVSKTYSVSVGAGLLVGDAIGLRGNASTVSAGTHTLKIWISLPNNAGDLDSSNDTLTTTFTVGTTGQALPFTENFESTSGGQIPATWTRYNRDAFSDWFVYSMTGNKAMAFNNYAYTGAQNSPDELTLPILDLSGSSSAWLTFDLSHTSRVTATVFDSLEVLISTDCGQSFTSLWGKGGAALNTVPAQSTIFIPTGPADYQKVQIDLSAYTGSSNAILRFVNWSNNGNSTLIDNVNLTTSVTEVEENASLLSLDVFPNPAAEMIQVTCQLQKKAPLKIKIVNAFGQTVEEANYGEQSGTHVSKIDVKKYPSGIYNLLVSSGDDKMMVKKIVVLK